MRWQSLLLVPVFSLFAIGIRATADDVPKGLEKMQGSWTLTALTVEGKEIKDAKGKLTVKGDKYTFHIEGGEAYFQYPPSPVTIEETLKEVMRCTRDGIRINTFMLDESYYLKSFVEQMMRVNGGRAFFTNADTLGDYVLVDFLDHRRQHRRAG